MSRLCFATRPSKLARWQTTYIQQALSEFWPDLMCSEMVITTEGDRELDRPLPEIGGKGLFTQELERALLEGRVDAAVHSLKDLPIENTPGLVLGLIPKRAAANDVLISRYGQSLDELPPSSVIGTSSLRRMAQILAYRPNLKIEPIRGNVDTRVRKLFEGQYDAIVLAQAGISRLGLDDHITQILPIEIMLPAPGQGALAVQCRKDDLEILGYLSALEDQRTRDAVEAERTFLGALGGGCSLPIGAYAENLNGELRMQASVVSTDGEHHFRVEGHDKDPIALGENLAREAMALGAGKVLYA
jgi:hydroxymethylbilane synthase